MIDRARADMPPPVRAFLDHGVDFVQADTLDELIERMNKVTDTPLLDPETVRREIIARDREMDNDYTKDLQIAALRQARSYLPDKITRVASPHKLTDPKAGPMIAVRLNILTRKTLGGLNTDLDSRVLGARRRADPRAVRGRRGRRLRRRRHARLPLAGGDVPRRLHLQRPRGRPGGRSGGALSRGRSG